jgi:hypothetical protein
MIYTPPGKQWDFSNIDPWEFFGLHGWALRVIQRKYSEEAARQMAHHEFSKHVEHSRSAISAWATSFKPALKQLSKQSAS